MPEISNQLHDELTAFLRGMPMWAPSRWADQACTLAAMLGASAPEPSGPRLGARAAPRLTGRPYEPIGYRADMVNAGRGHLLGD
jgi:hypothetical protein